MMKHLKSFNEEISNETTALINEEDIRDIMTEITDKFRSYNKSGEYRNSSLNLVVPGRHTQNDRMFYHDTRRAPVVEVKYLFNIPEDQMNEFKICLNQIKHRFKSMLGLRFSTELSKFATDIPYRYSLQFVIFDAKLNTINESDDIRASTNRINIISRGDIEDIMTEITDNFKYKHDETDIYNTSEIIMKSLKKRVVKAKYILEIPDSKMEFFEKCLKQAEWRFHSFFHGNFSKYFGRYKSTGIPTYLLFFTFDDSKLEGNEIDPPWKPLTVVD